MTEPVRIGLVAGEMSGDLLGAALMRQIRALQPEVSFVGIGGPQMQAEGLESLFAMEKLSVMGLVEVAGRLRELLGIRDELVTRLTGDLPVQLFIGIDAPDFNLRVSARLRSHGIRTVQYVSPSVWAWRPGRIKSIRQAVDLVLCLFPFEVEFYQRHDMAAVFVGHPLAQTMPLDHQVEPAKRQLGLSPQRRQVALLPGSRGGEVARLLPLMFEVAAVLHRQDPSLGFLVPVASAAREHQIRQLHNQLPESLRHAIRLMVDRQQRGSMGRQVMAASDVVLLASGTATLEALLLERPMVVVYRLHWMTYWLARWLVRIPHVALPNILAGRQVVPELIQHQARVEAVSEAVQALLQPQAAAAQQQVLHALHVQLQGSAAVNPAQAVLALLPATGGGV